MISQFIKDYGSIISPTIAFVLGIVAVLIKYGIDNIVQKRRTKKSFIKAKEMLAKIHLPDYCEGPNKKSPHEFMHATMARNLSNISRLYFSLSATYKYLQSLEKDINQSKNLLIINQYFYLVWRVENMITEIKAIRESSDVDASTWHSLQKEIPELLEFLNDDWFSLKNS